MRDLPAELPRRRDRPPLPRPSEPRGGAASASSARRPPRRAAGSLPSSTGRRLRMPADPGAARAGGAARRTRRAAHGPACRRSRRSSSRRAGCARRRRPRRPPWPPRTARSTASRRGSHRPATSSRRRSPHVRRTPRSACELKAELAAVQDGGAGDRPPTSAARSIACSARVSARRRGRVARHRRPRVQPLAARRARARADGPPRADPRSRSASRASTCRAACFITFAFGGEPPHLRRLARPRRPHRHRRARVRRAARCGIGSRGALEPRGRHRARATQTRACEQRGQQGLLRVQPVLGLIPDGGAGAVEHRLVDLLAVVRGQAVQHDAVVGEQRRRGARPRDSRASARRAARRPRPPGPSRRTRPSPAPERRVRPRPRPR